jgi:hypothetical protein
VVGAVSRPDLIDDREPPICGHSPTWSLGPGHPQVCCICHPRPGSTPPWPRSAPDPEPFAYSESKLHPSPWADELRRPPATYCNICGVELHPEATEPDDPQLDCGGDCWGCIRAIEEAHGFDEELGLTTAPGGPHA